MADLIHPVPGVWNDQAQWEAEFRTLATDAVVEGLRVSVSAGPNLLLTPGRARSGGYTYERTAGTVPIPVNPNPAGANTIRLDKLVIRRVWASNGSMSFLPMVLYGTPLPVNPLPPTLAKDIGGPGNYDLEIASWQTVGTTISNLVHKNYGPFPQVLGLTAGRFGVPIDGSHEITGVGYKMSFGPLASTTTPEVPEVGYDDSNTVLVIRQTGVYKLEGKLDTGTAVTNPGFVHLQYSFDGSNWPTLNVCYFAASAFKLQFTLGEQVMQAGMRIRIGVARTVATQGTNGEPAGTRSVSGDLTLTMTRAL